MTVDELIRAADPADALVGRAGLEPTWRWHYQEISQGHRHRRRQRRMAIAVAVPVVLVAALVAAVVPQLTSTPPSAAAAVLDAAASTVGSQPSVTLAPGQYLYQDGRSVQQVAVWQPAAGTRSGMPRLVADATYTETSQWWIGATGAARFVLQNGPLQFSSPADEAAWNSSIGPSWAARTLGPSVVTGTGATTRLTDVATLPTDPQALAVTIANGTTGTAVDHTVSGPNATFGRAATLLVGPTDGMTPALKSALYQVMATQPNATVATDVTGTSGAQGTAISISGAGPGQVDRIIVDPQTGAALEVDRAMYGSTYTAIGATSTGSEPGLGTVRAGPLWSATTTSVVSSATSTAPIGS